MATFKSLFFWARQLYYKLTVFIWKIMTTLKLETFKSGTYKDIDASKVHSVFSNGAVVVVVFKDMSSLVFPATPENVLMAGKLEALLKKHPRP